MSLKSARLAFLFAAFGLLSAQALDVTDVTARQRWPWNNLVDIDFVVVTNGTEMLSVFSVDVTGTWSNGTKTVNASTFVTSIDDAKAGANRVTWNIGADYPGMRLADLALTVTASEQPAYLVIDLSGGASASSYPTRFSIHPPNLSDDTCRTTELWLRRIPAGTFTMGSPGGELGRLTDGSETQHAVTLTRGYYMGIFEVTQQQWYQVLGTKPSYYNNAAYWSTRPVETVSYDHIRGSSSGTNWPAASMVDPTSFIGKLRAKTGIDAFDLPTDAQWEYACRAGKTTSLNNGANITNSLSDANLNTLARYKFNDGYVNGVSQPPQSCSDTNATAKVGSYLPNAWGLYDMHGNVWERCLDWITLNLGTVPVEDPVGGSAVYQRVVRGGGCWDTSNYCRAAMRASAAASFIHARQGFRLAKQP